MKSNFEMVFQSYSETCEDADKLYAVKTIFKHLCRACEVDDISQIGADRFWDLERTFKKYLLSPESGLSKKTQREYRHRLRHLLKHARLKGFYTHYEPEISPEWMDAALEGGEKIHRVAYWAVMKVGKFATRCNFQICDCDRKFFESFYQYLCSPEGGVQDVRISYGRVKRALMQLYPDDFPESRFYLIPSKVNESYRLPMSEWNESFMREGDIYIHWHTARYVKGRPKKCIQKEVTNIHNVQRLERYAGFLYNKKRIPKDKIDFDALLDYENVISFIDYLDDVNGPNGQHQKTYLATFRSIACNFMPLALGRECRDKEALIEIHSDYNTAPRFRPEDFADRYEEIVMIADEILKLRNQYEQRNRKARATGRVEISEMTIASLYMKELLVRLALKRPFRSRNFSEMCIGENLIVKNNRYFIRMVDQEIKTGRHIGYVEFPFPTSLMPLLEDYLLNQRPVLQNGTHEKNLFLSRVGTPLCKHQVRRVFHDWSQQVHGKHLTTHHIRHIAATGYLKRHPGDFLTLQKMLMHRRLETTIRVYGQFNEAHASVHFDEFSDAVDVEVNVLNTSQKKRKKDQSRPSKAVEMVLRMEQE